MLTLFLEFETVTQVLVAFGEQGVSAEAVANRAAGVPVRLLKTNVSVEPHVTDHLLLPMASSGAGSFRTLAPAPHATTYSDIIRRFMDLSISMTANGEDVRTMRVETLT